MAIERAHLQQLPAEGFDLAAVTFPKVNGSGCAPVLTNFYSAPLPPGDPRRGQGARCLRRDLARRKIIPARCLKGP
jgi:hypothetical protein